MKAVSIIGFKDTGKSTLAAALAEEFKNLGLSVASMKHSAHGFDKADTDTSRMLEHCQVVAGISGHETFISWPKKIPLPDLLPLMKADVLIIEGGKSLTWLPRIICNTTSRDEEIKALKLHLSIGETDLNALSSPQASDIVRQLAQTVFERGFALPGLDCKECGMPNCEAMSAAIVAGTRTPADCKALKTQVEVNINGVPMPMGGFIENIVASTIRGLLSELKGYAPGEIRIRIP